MGGTEEERRASDIEQLIEVGFLKRAECHGYVLDAQLGDNADAYKAAEKAGLSRTRVDELVSTHDSECPGCLAEEESLFK
ncbi:MAG: hypothetical protein U0587_15660 [Candidatus Binatia bacterium]